MALILKDDRYFVYTGGFHLLDVLANDILPANYTLTSDSNHFFHKKVVGDQIEVARGSTFLTEKITYTVTDNDTGDTATANVELFTMKGKPGLGGFTLRQFGKYSEDDGIVTIDLKSLVDPQGTTSGSTYSQPYLRDFDLNIDFPDLSADLVDGVAIIDMDQFSPLHAGDSLTVFFSFQTAFEGETAESEIRFVVTGADDTTTTISFANANGTMIGDANNNIFETRLNLEDKLIGGPGQNTFKFTSDYFDSDADSDVILDFDYDRDKIEFQSGTEISSIFEVDDGVILTFDDGRDTLYIFGDDLTFDALSMTGYDFKPLESNTDLTLAEQLAINNLVFLYNSQLISDVYLSQAGIFTPTFGFGTGF